MMNVRIRVTEPQLPSVERLQSIVADIVDSGVITNNGNLLQRFEVALAASQSVRQCNIVCNATVGLMIALRAVGACANVVTTPFSFAATTSVLEFLGIQPRFCDIAENSPNINAHEIRNHITDDVSAIVPVHCYGIACDVDIIQNIADEKHIKIVYDAAHCISTQIGKRSIFEYGDASVVSLHATKILNSVEGGAIFSRDDLTNQRVQLMRNFGISGMDRIDDVGINGKMSEFHAAVGLLNLETLNDVLEHRKSIAERYHETLNNSISCVIDRNAPNNYGYFPIRFSSQQTRDVVYHELLLAGILSRRYFSPLLSDRYHEDASKMFPNAYSFVNTVLCLPIHSKLQHSEVREIVDIVNSFTHANY